MPITNATKMVQKFISYAFTYNSKIIFSSSLYKKAACYCIAHKICHPLMLGEEDTSYAVNQWLFLGYGQQALLWQSCIANILVNIIAI